MTASEIKDRLRSIKLEASRLRAKLRRLEPKPARPKRRKAPDKAAAERATAWNLMLKVAEYCEACGRTRFDVPAWWRAEFCLDRAHIVGGTGKRKEDPRLCVILCRACHHQQTIGRAVAGCDLEPLTLAHLHCIKLEHTDYDPVFLRKHSNKPLPAPQLLPLGYARSMYRFQGKRLDESTKPITRLK
jgi:hypothetical protein